METAAIDPYHGVALGVESAWPTYVQLDASEPLAHTADDSLEQPPSLSIPTTA